MSSNIIMTEGTPWKKILFFSIPILLGNLFQQLYITIDTWIVGVYVSQEALSAVGTVSVLVYLCLAFASGFSAGAGILISQYFGAREYDKLSQNAWNALYLVGEISLAITVVAIIFSKVLLRYLVNVPESILHISDVYFRIIASGFFFQFIYNGISAVLRSIGDSKATLYFLIASSIFNAFLDYILVVKFKYGVQGAAWATVLSQVFCCIISYFYMINKYEMFRFNRKKNYINVEIIRNILKQGIPLAIQAMIGTFYNLFMQRLVNSFGEAMTASYTVVSRVEGYIQLPTSSLTTTMATYTAQNRGANNTIRIKIGILQGIVISVGFTFLLSLPSYMFAKQIAIFFGIEGQSVMYCIKHIQYYAFFMLTFAAYYPLVGYYQGNGKAYLSTLSSVLYLSMSLFIGYFFKSFIAEKALFISKPITWTVVALINYIYVFLGKSHLSVRRTRKNYN